MTTKAQLIANRRLWPSWQAKEKRPYNAATAIGPSPNIGPTTAECSAPVSPPVVAPSDAEYARRAAAISAKRRGTRFYDGFHP